jgi:hypothetical protein
MQNPHAPHHLISPEPNFLRTPSTPTQETIHQKEKKEKPFNPLSKNSFGKGEKKPSPSFSLFLNFHLITLRYPHFTLLDPTEL